MNFVQVPLAALHDSAVMYLATHPLARTFELSGGQSALPASLVCMIHRSIKRINFEAKIKNVVVCFITVIVVETNMDVIYIKVNHDCVNLYNEPWIPKLDKWWDDDQRGYGRKVDYFEYDLTTCFVAAGNIFNAYEICKVKTAGNGPIFFLCLQ